MVAPPTPQRIPLHAAVDRYLDSVTAQVTVGALREATRNNYASDLTNFIDALGSDIITDDITGEDVDRAVSIYGNGEDKRYTKTLKDGRGRSVATQKRFYESVSRFFGHAAKHGWVQVSPMQWTTLKPTVRGDLRVERTALTSQQARALLEHGAGHPQQEVKRSHEDNYVRDKLLLSLLVVLGPRVEEVASTNRGDIVREDDETVWRIVGKGGKVRRVPLSTEMVELLNTYLGQLAKRDEESVHRKAEAARHRAEAEKKSRTPKPVPADPDPRRTADAAKALFRTGRGFRLSSRDIQRITAKAVARVREQEPSSARDFTPHALRHTAATLMLGSGWDVKVVSQLLGHTNIAATQRYLDQIPGELAAAIRSNPLLSQVLPAQPRQDTVLAEEPAARGHLTIQR